MVPPNEGGGLCPSGHRSRKRNETTKHHDHRRRSNQNHRTTATGNRRSIAELARAAGQNRRDTRRILSQITRRNLKSDSESYELPRYLFVGPQRRRHADPHRHFRRHPRRRAGRRLTRLSSSSNCSKPSRNSPPDIILSFYPVCNPTGFEDRTRFSRGGKDLNREFWRNSSRAGSPAAPGRTDFALVPGNHLAAHR